MLTTTFELVRTAGACRESYFQFAEHVGGVTKYGIDKPIPLSEITHALGIQDAIWTLRCTLEPAMADRLGRLFAAACAERVLHFFEDRYPDDPRPRKAIEVARLYANGHVGDAALDAAFAAARDAAWPATATGTAAWTAARDAGAAAFVASRTAARTAARAAGAAAFAAARDAGDAAFAASGTAAGDAGAAEKEWQLKRFIEMLTEVST